MKLHFILMTAGLFMSACSQPTLVDKQYQIPEEGWTYSDTLGWIFDVKDTLQIYNIRLTIEHERDFAFQNCYVKFYTLFPKGESTEQVVSLDMQTPSGKWYGKCGKETCVFSIPIQENAFFNQIGQHQIRMEQYMRKDSLVGIHTVRLVVEATQNKRTI